MSTAEKIIAYVEGQRIPEPTECYAVPGEDHIIDCIHPIYDLTVYGAKTLEQIRAEKGYALAERMTIEEFCRQKAARQDSPITWEPITEERYWEIFEVLPPIVRGSGFLCSEPWDHHAMTGRPRYGAYRKRGEVYEAASRPMTVKEFEQVQR